MTRKLTKPLLIATFLVAACAEGPFLTWEPETDAEREVRLSVERLDRTVTQGTVFGTLGGGLLGALTGGVEGAFQGAEVGRFGGAGAGSYVRALQKDFANQEAILDQVARDIASTNEELERTITHMRNLLAERRAVAASLTREVSATKATQETERSRRNLGEMNKNVTAAENRVKFFSAARSIVSTAPEGRDAKIDPQIAAMRAKIQTMREIAGTLETSL